MSAWREIESAPKDGQPILASWHAPNQEFMAVGVIFFSAGEWLTFPGYWGKEPTHWQPLPDPPNV